jgi:hypothetical protein
VRHANHFSSIDKVVVNVRTAHWRTRRRVVETSLDKVSRDVFLSVAPLAAC